MFFAKPNHDIIRQHFTIKITLYILRMFFSGFINAAKLFNDHKVVALMMFACGGLFVVNALLEIILLRKVCIITNVFWDHIFFLDLDFFFFLDNFTIFFVMSLSGLWKTTVLPRNNLSKTASKTRLFRVHFASETRASCVRLASSLRPNCGHFASIVRVPCVHCTGTVRPPCGHFASALRLRANRHSRIRTSS